MARWTGGMDEEGPGPYVLVGRYQLLERLGEGGMGVVWRCFDLDLEEPVAVKFLREDYASDDRLRARFRREVKLARRVTHPNVARVFEFGKTESLHFLTMEFVPGESLLALLARERALPPARVVALASSLCRGLAAAHAAGVVHGDIKPGNVLIDPQRGAVLTDFGIARARSEVLRGDEQLGGTPMYMPPEQLLNEAMAPQNDIYAVGVLLFEALTGQVPWPSDDAATLIACKLSGEPDLKALAPGLPVAWAALIADCLRTDPGRRPADGRALLGRLIALREAATPVGIPSASAYLPSAPLNTGDGPRWLEVVPFAALDEPGSRDGAWATGDLVDARSAARSRPGGPAHPQVTQLRGSRRAVLDARIVGAAIVAPRSAVRLRQPRTARHDLGADLAARLVELKLDAPGSPTQVEAPLTRP